MLHCQLDGRRVLRLVHGPGGIGPVGPADEDVDLLQNFVQKGGSVGMAGTQLAQSSDAFHELPQGNASPSGHGLPQGERDVEGDGFGQQNHRRPLVITDFHLDASTAAADGLLWLNV